MEIYPNDRAKDYVELERLSPLATLKQGESLSLTVAYRLRER